MLILRTIFVVSLTVCLWLFLQRNTEHINGITPQKKLSETDNDSILPGKQLALKYCTPCHLFPEPSLLDKKTWINNVLPNMGWRLGVRDGKDPYTDIVEDERKILKAMHIYPETPAISKENRNKIVQYFIRQAPEIPLPQKPHETISDLFSLFTSKPITFEDKLLPQTTLLKFDSLSNELYVGDAQPKLYILDNHFDFKSAWNVESAPVDIGVTDNAPARVLTTGSVVPSDLHTGRLLSFDTSFSISQPLINIDSLARPVQFACGDLDIDGKEDVVICNFGNNTGHLSWYSNFQLSKEHILKNLPGARKVEIRDFNKDGKPDIMVLMAQAWEQVLLFYNLGNGKFKEKKLLSFPPVFGAAYFELADFNKDGYDDILLANGDNWDYSRINKNYHGVRIYLNDGKDNFKEKWFYPLYGASKAMARDFDNDGDLDIAAISFYTDLEKPENGFVYFSNEGNNHYKPFSLPAASMGKWLTMEAGDFDHDGDMDIVLGSYFHNVIELSKMVNEANSNTLPQLLVLENMIK